MQNRRVAIIGRPNVGKSAIFNRLVGKQIAIVHNEKGITIDRIMTEVRWGGELFELIDTGGITLIDKRKSDEIISNAIYRQVEIALSEAAVIILVVDITAGISPLDEEAATLARKTSKPVFVAANKSDNAANDKDAGEFEKLGFPVYPVSALHNRGFDKLMTGVIKELPPAVLLVENEDIAPLRIAIVGRPNVGKSSLINKLLNNERIVVSPVPGTTRDSISVPFSIKSGDYFRKYEFVDTAGLRYEHKVRDTVEFFSRIRTKQSIDSANIVVLMLDALDGPTTQDKKIASLIVESRKCCLILVNKWDLAQKISQREYIEAVGKEMPFLHRCHILCVSAVTGYNIRRFIEVVNHLGGIINCKIPTGILNRVVINACERVNPPAVGSDHLKIFYVTQIKKEPVMLEFFVNNPVLVKDHYKNYLIETIRESFDLFGIPIILKFKARRK